jgi:hypothetical protein
VGLEDEARAAQTSAVLAFVVKERQPRWLRAIERPGRDKRNPIRLADPWEFDEARRTSIARHEHTVAGIVTLLRSQGAGDQAWLMTTAYPAERRTLAGAVAEALTEVCALVICEAKNPLAYLRTEVGGGFLLASRMGA